MAKQKWERRRQADRKGRRKKGAPKVSGSMILRFGKFAGKRLNNVPADYLLDLAANHYDSKDPQVQDIIWWVDRHPKAIFSGLRYD